MIDLSILTDRAEQQDAYGPLSESDIEVAESEIGFALPPLLKTIYQEIGDGGFGPGYGFIGLLVGPDELPNESIVGLYCSFRKEDPEEPSFVWPDKLLPILDWGCAIRSCVDCSKPSLPVIRFDPNEEGERQFYPENYDFEDWLQAWLDGVDHWTGNQS